jgi:ABC-type glycerol-3-phosphate transport system substrate-binding protein
LLTQALNAIVIDRQPVRQALRAAQTALSEYVAQVRLTPQPTSDGAPIVVATPLPAALPGSVTITFAAPRFIADQLREATRAFHQDNPNIVVALAVSDSPGASGSLSDMASSPDCFAWPEVPRRDRFAALLDLQPLLDADVAFPRDDYPPPLLAPFKQATGQYGLPYMVFFRALHYNVSAFDAAGIAHPSAAWTLSDFLGAAQQ